MDREPFLRSIESTAMYSVIDSAFNMETYFGRSMDLLIDNCLEHIDSKSKPRC